MHGAQCDTCRVFVTNMPTGWMILNRITLMDNGPMYPQSEGAQVLATFCSIKCLTEYSYTVLATEKT